MSFYRYCSLNFNIYFYCFLMWCNMVSLYSMPVKVLKIFAYQTHTLVKALAFSIHLFFFSYFTLYSNKWHTERSLENLSLPVCLSSWANLQLVYLLAKAALNHSFKYQPLIINSSLTWVSPPPAPNPPPLKRKQGQSDGFANAQYSRETKLSCWGFLGHVESKRLCSSAIPVSLNRLLLPQRTIRVGRIHSNKPIPLANT